MPTKAEIRALVRKQLLYYLENDLKGAELLMKEVWEECATVADVAEVKRELAEIIELLHARDRGVVVD